MGFFDLFKKKTMPTNALQTNSFGEQLDRLNAEGELPWGWVTRNKDFCDKIQGEFTYFLNTWLESRNKHPMVKYQALKSFVLYLRDVKNVCKQKGECFEFWFYEILTSRDYLSQREVELEDLTLNFDSYQSEYENKIMKEAKVNEMKEPVIILLKENDGILQSQFWQLFDDEICKESAKDIVYELIREGKIERTKSGRSFTLHYKG